MKTFVVVGVLLVAIMLFAIEREESREDKLYREWLVFSQLHHCKITKPPTFSSGSTIWDCDGFQVVRLP